MDDKPCRERVYPLQMARVFVSCYGKYLHWLRHLLERLGREPALRIWSGAFADHEDKLLVGLLTSGWQAVEGKPTDVEDSVEAALRAAFGLPVGGVTLEQARDIVEASPPIAPIRQRFSDLNLVRETTTYEALHLSHKGLAMLAEALINRHGKRGEFIAYDAKASWVAANRGAEMPAEAFLDLFKVPLDQQTFQGAGLTYELVRASQSEVVLHITECELARYYLGHHPRVGYLMACSMDEMEYRAVNDRIRMQRTSTLMEGGALCDFRIYAIGKGA